VVWLLGWENRFRPVLDEALAGHDFESKPNSVTLAGKTLDREEYAVVVLARHRGNPDRALAWVAADDTAAMPGLARKLPHYGKYSYLGFTGDEPENVLKGQWPVTRSPLSVVLVDGPVPALALGPRPALAELPPAISAELPPAISAERMMEHAEQQDAESRTRRAPGSEPAAGAVTRR
jgi:hypothetical protein